MIFLVALSLAANIAFMPVWIGPTPPATPHTLAAPPPATLRAAPPPRPAPDPPPAGSCTRQAPCTGPRGGLYYYSASGRRTYLRR